MVPNPPPREAGRCPKLPVLAACLSLAFGVGAADAPRVFKVDPPSWWVGHSWNPVRLLIEGRNLADATLSAPRGLTASNLTISANGQWALASVTIDSNTSPGPRTLTLTTSAGSAAVPFELLRLPLLRGRFQGFSPDDVIYLLMPDRFANGSAANDNPAASPGLLDRSQPRHYHGGDLIGVLHRLPYLKQLGVTALWLTPWYDNVNHLNQLEKYTADNQRSTSGVPSTDYHGYGAVDFYCVEEHFGDLANLRQLVAEAQTAGLKIIQDQVANHTGPYHRWATNPPTPTWYNGTVADHLENTWQTWTVAEPNPPQDKLKATLDGWFINLLPDLNQNDPETSAYLIQNSLWWLGMTGLDAVRQDTLPYVPRTYWARWTSALKREYPRLTILGEMWDGNPKLVAFFQGGQTRFDGVDSGIDTLFDFPLHYALRDVFAKGQRMSRLTEVLAADTNYVNPRVLVTFLGLHDTPRFLNEPGATLQGLKLAFTYLLTTRGTPLIYYGDEIAMRGAGDPDNRRDFPGGWREDPRSAFTRQGRTEEQQEMLAHVQLLLGLRKRFEPLRRGDLIQLAGTDDTCAFARVTPQECVILAFNNCSQARNLELPLAAARIAKVKALTDHLGDLGTLRSERGNVRITLPPRTAALLTP